MNSFELIKLILEYVVLILGSILLIVGGYKLIKFPQKVKFLEKHGMMPIHETNRWNLGILLIVTFLALVTLFYYMLLA